MSNSGGIITKPISLEADVYSVLGLSKTGTYYDVGYACGNSHGKINKWARHKPIRYRYPCMPCPNPSGDVLITAMNADFAVGTDENGLVGGLRTNTMPVCTSSGTSYVVNQSMLTYLGGSIYEAFEYMPPDAADGYWYRLADFENYRHTSNWLFTGDVPFTAQASAGAGYIGGRVNLTLHVGIQPTEADTDYQLNAIAMIQNKHIGLQIRRNNNNVSLTDQWRFGGNDYLYVTTEKALSLYPLGDTEEKCMTVTKVDEWQYSFAIRLPQKSDGILDNTAACFDDYDGRTCMLFPIFADQYLCYLDVGSNTAEIGKLAARAADYTYADFTLTDANPNYSAPTIALSMLTTSITYAGNVASVALTNVRITLTSTGGNRVYNWRLGGVTTSIFIRGKDTSGSTVDIFKTTQQGTYSGSHTMTLNYPSGSTSSLTLTPNAVATTTKSTGGGTQLSSPKAYLRVYVTLTETYYGETVQATTDIALDIADDYLVM